MSRIDSICSSSRDTQQAASRGRAGGRAKVVGPGGSQGGQREPALRLCPGAIPAWTMRRPAAAYAASPAPARGQPMSGMLARVPHTPSGQQLAVAGGLASRHAPGSQARPGPSGEAECACACQAAGACTCHASLCARMHHVPRRTRQGHRGRGKGRGKGTCHCPQPTPISLPLPLVFPRTAPRGPRHAGAHPPSLRFRPRPCLSAPPAYVRPNTHAAHSTGGCAHHHAAVRMAASARGLYAPIRAEHPLP